MNWVDEGALYSQIGLFLREDLGRGDLTSQSILARNTRARGRFVAGETMIVAGLEATEEVFLTLDSQQQLEAFVSDGEQVEAGKLIARVVGFADVLLAGERVALNLIQHLSGVATLTNQFVKAVAGTTTQIVDSRASTPGLRMLERYALVLAGGVNGRFGLDDGVLITSNHCVMSGGIATAVKTARERLGHLHRIVVEVADENDVAQAVEQGADGLVIENMSLDDAARLIARARELSDRISIECGGSTVTVETARAFAEAGADRLSIDMLSSRAVQVSFKISPF
ncbi:MAG TPA: carboxylating nicotinate-nucleotide diphosphorylase [Pyrinomonadaceae bacterium]|jgi:nicotinate-nucleotide pyrophosphorylase (carboxylating)